MGPGKLAKYRRLSQVGFFILFMLLLLRTEFCGSVRGTANDIRLPYPVRLFFELDPLVGLSNALASHALYRGLLWSLLICCRHALSRPILLRLDLPDGIHPSLLRQPEVGEQAWQATHRVQPLQALADHEILPSACGAGRARLVRDWLAGSILFRFWCARSGSPFCPDRTMP